MRWILLLLLCATQSHASLKWGCADLFATQGTFVTANFNAETPMYFYTQANKRNFSIYAHTLGTEFQKIFKQKSIHWLDVGGGFGIAAIEKVLDTNYVSATVINAQNAWSSIPDCLDDADFRDKSNLIRLGMGLRVSLTDILDFRTSQLYAGWRKKLIQRIRNKYDKLEQTNRFKYMVGYAERIIPYLEPKFNVVTDVFGAYFYSIDRVKLIDDYYNSMTVGAEGFVIYYIEEYSPGYMEKYGPISYVEDRGKSFEDVLVELYPSIFSTYTVQQEEGLVRILHIRRNIRNIDLRSQFKVTHYRYEFEHPIDVMQQIPIITIRQL